MRMEHFAASFTWNVMAGEIVLFAERLAKKCNLFNFVHWLCSWIYNIINLTLSSRNYVFLIH